MLTGKDRHTTALTHSYVNILNITREFLESENNKTTHNFISNFKKFLCHDSKAEHNK